MANKAIRGSYSLAEKIKIRRNELGLTIEDAARKASVGTKTWCRYEAGESIRIDKCKGICKALNWRELPDEFENANTGDVLDIKKYKENEAWSSFISETFGEYAAISFIVGSDMLLDELSQDISQLAQMPNGSHLGQLDASYLVDSLPKQFLMRYNYDFLYNLKSTIIQLRDFVKSGQPIIAHSVIQELSLYLISEEARSYFECCNPVNAEVDDDWFDWVFDIFDDEDIVMFLFSDIYVSNANSYHFDNWTKDQFYCDHS